MPFDKMKRRSQFLDLASKGRRCVRPGLVLQGRFDSASERPIIGFTVTRKVGNAVVRNRVKRRLRAAAFELAKEKGVFRPGDYVLIGRKETILRPYADLLNDLRSALRRLGRDASDKPRPFGRPRGVKRPAS